MGHATEQDLCQALTKIGIRIEVDIRGMCMEARTFVCVFLLQHSRSVVAELSRASDSITAKLGGQDGV
jgi:hypothetical protein